MASPSEQKTLQALDPMPAPQAIMEGAPKSPKSLTSPHMASPPAMEALPSSQPIVKIFDINEPIENDGLTAAQLFSNDIARPALTYGDIIMLPGHVSFGVDEVSLRSKLSRNIELRVPFVSSPMDTVSEWVGLVCRRCISSGPLKPASPSGPHYHVCGHCACR